MSATRHCLLAGSASKRAAAHRLIAIDHRLKEKAGGITIILLHQASVCQHWRQVVAEDALKQRHHIALAGCCLELLKVRALSQLTMV